jgi:hypothetical protein
MVNCEDFGISCKMRKNDVVRQRYFELSRQVKNPIGGLHGLTAAFALCVFLTESC